jgi:hypothetical protein
VRVVRAPEAADPLCGGLDVEDESLSARLLERPLPVRREVPKRARDKATAVHRQAVDVPGVARSRSLPAPDDFAALRQPEDAVARGCHHHEALFHEEDVVRVGQLVDAEVTRDPAVVVKEQFRAVAGLSWGAKQTREPPSATARPVELRRSSCSSLPSSRQNSPPPVSSPKVEASRSSSATCLRFTAR